MPVRRWMSPWYCQASDVSPHVTCSACLRPVATRQWPSQWCRVVFRSHYLVLPEKTARRVHLHIGDHNGRGIFHWIAVQGIGGDSDLVSGKIIPIVFRCSRQNGISLHNFSNMSTIVSVLVRATMRQSATIFLNMHLLENASMGRIAEKLPSAVIMEIILLWKRSFVRVSTSSVQSPIRIVQRKWLGAKSIIVRQVLSNLYARNVVDHIVLLSALMCDAVWSDAARWRCWELGAVRMGWAVVGVAIGCCCFAIPAYSSCCASHCRLAQELTFLLHSPRCSADAAGSACSRGRVEEGRPREHPRGPRSDEHQQGRCRHSRWAHDL